MTDSDALAAMVASWRLLAQEHSDGEYDDAYEAYTRCADELERVLDTPTPGT